MASVKASGTGLGPACYRLTVRGRASMATRDASVPGPLSAYQQDVLEMCGTGVWYAQLQQFMPPRSLDESLRSLLDMGLVETVDPGEAPRHVVLAQPPKNSNFGDLMRA